VGRRNTQGTAERVHEAGVVLEILLGAFFTLVSAHLEVCAQRCERCAADGPLVDMHVLITLMVHGAGRRGYKRKVGIERGEGDAAVVCMPRAGNATRHTKGSPPTGGLRWCTMDAQLQQRM